MNKKGVCMHVCVFECIVRLVFMCVWYCMTEVDIYFIYSNIYMKLSVFVYMVVKVYNYECI